MPCPILCVQDLQGEENRDHHPAPEGVDLSILDPEKAVGGLVLGTEVKERTTGSADRKVFRV